VLAALAAHRHVFVEKPLCLTTEELAEIDTGLARSRGSVQVGFNRRFAAAAVELKRVLREIPGPKTASFRVMAGALDPAHWYANYAESGGRVLGEACHFLDFFCYLFDARPVRVFAQAVTPARGRLAFPDSVAVHVEFDGGSCGQLVYSADGDPSWPKEVCTVFAGGLTAEIENFQRLTVCRGRRRRTTRHDGKGHAEQMSAWAAFLNAREPQPVRFEDVRQSMQLTFAVLESLRTRRAVMP
jgi:predicted dehydrogenase